MATINKDGLRIELTDEYGSSVNTTSIESHLLLKIIEKLEQIRCNQIDIETELKNLKNE